MTEGTDRDDWNLEEVLAAWADALGDELHTAIPSRIESYDRGTQKAVVQPIVRRNLEREDGSVAVELLPPVRGVPVFVSRGGGYFGPHFDLTPGDFALLIIAERDFSRFLQTGQLSNAPDSRLHHLAHAIAMPGLFPNASKLTGLTAGTMQLGRVGGPSIITVTSSEIQLGGTTALAEHPNLDAHLAAISADLVTIAAAIGGAPIPEPTLTYGTATGRPALIASNPIPTTITKGD